MTSVLQGSWFHFFLIVDHTTKDPVYLAVWALQKSTRRSKLSEEKRRQRKAHRLDNIAAESIQHKKDCANHIQDVGIGIRLAKEALEARRIRREKRRKRDSSAATRVQKQDQKMAEKI